MKIITRYDLEGLGIRVPQLDSRLTSGAERQARANSIGGEPIYLGPAPSTDPGSSVGPNLPTWVIFGGSIAIGLLAYFTWFRKAGRGVR